MGQKNKMWYLLTKIPKLEKMEINFDMKTVHKQGLGILFTKNMIEYECEE